jgi:hypothetical protein
MKVEESCREHHHHHQKDHFNKLYLANEKQIREMQQELLKGDKNLEMKGNISAAQIILQPFTDEKVLTEGKNFKDIMI